VVLGSIESEGSGDMFTRHASVVPSMDRA